MKSFYGVYIRPENKLDESGNLNVMTGWVRLRYARARPTLK
jgi:hypothetical protein